MLKARPRSRPLSTEPFARAPRSWHMQPSPQTLSQAARARAHAESLFKPAHPQGPAAPAATETVSRARRQQMAYLRAIGPRRDRAPAAPEAR